MDRGAWQATLHKVTKNQKERLSMAQESALKLNKQGDNIQA